MAKKQCTTGDKPPVVATKTAMSETYVYIDGKYTGEVIAFNATVKQISAYYQTLTGQVICLGMYNSVNKAKQAIVGKWEYHHRKDYDKNEINR